MIRFYLYMICLSSIISTNDIFAQNEISKDYILNIKSDSIETIQTTKYNFITVNGELKSEKFVYKSIKYFDKKGLILKSILNDSLMNIKNIETFLYNDKDQLFKYQFETNDSIAYYEISKYNNNGLLIEVIVYDKNDSFMNKYVYSYDESNKRNKCKGIYPNASISHIMYYDDKEYIVHTEYENPISKYKYYHTYKFNEKGNLIEEKIEMLLNNHLSTLFYRYEYNEIGKFIMTFDSSSYNGSVNNTTYSYKYNDKGNVLEGMASQNDIPIYLIKVEYTYYK